MQFMVSFLIITIFTLDENMKENKLNTLDWFGLVSFV